MRPISCSAERLRIVIRPSALTPMTPALAPASTASVNRRRLSMRSRARTMSSCCVRSSAVILLKVSPRWARSPSERYTGTWMLQVAGRHIVGGADQPTDRGDQPVGKIQPDPGRGEQHDQRDDREHQREGDLDAEPARLKIGVFADALLGCRQLLHHASDRASARRKDTCCRNRAASPRRRRDRPAG